MYAYNTGVSSSPSPGSACTSETDYSRQGTGSPTTKQAQILAIHMDLHDPAYMSSKTSHMDECLSVGSPPSEGRHSSATPSTSPYGTHDMNRPYTSVSPHSTKCSGREIVSHETSRSLLIAPIRCRHMTRRCRLLYPWQARLRWQKGLARCYPLIANTEVPSSLLRQQHLALGPTHLI